MSEEVYAASLRKWSVETMIDDAEPITTILTGDLPSRNALLERTLEGVDDELRKYEQSLSDVREVIKVIETFDANGRGVSQETKSQQITLARLKLRQTNKVKAEYVKCVRRLRMLPGL